LIIYYLRIYFKFIIWVEW